MSGKGRSVWREELSVGPKAIRGAGLVAKTCDVVELVGRAPGSVTAAEIMRRTGMPRATLYRILAALVARGLVRSDPVTQTYSLGFRFLEFAQNVWTSADIAAIAAPELRRLRDTTGETAYLAVPHHGSVLTLGKFEGAHERRSVASLGVRKPLHCTGQGKAILAFLPDAKLEAFIAQAPFERFTDRTVTSGTLLRAQLRIVRSRGYAIDDREILPDIRCVGAPVLDAGGHVVAAISVAGPDYRLTGHRAYQLGPELVDVTRRIAAQLGGPSPAADHPDRGAPVEAASGVRAFYGMAPTWVPESGALAWADKLAPSVHTTGPGERTVALGDRSGAIDAVMLGGGEVSVLIGGLAIGVRDGEIVRERALPDLARIRVIHTDPTGVPWAAVGSDGDGTTIVGRLKEDGRLEGEWSVAGPVGALAWDPGGERLYAADAERGVVLALEARTRRQRLFARIPKVSGTPVGLAVDAEGRPWVALRDGWSVARLDADGEVDHVTALPVPCPTALAFGGADGSRLYVTTASVGLSLETLDNAPLSGRLLTMEAGVRGHVVPAARYPV